MQTNGQLAGNVVLCIVLGFLHQFIKLVRSVFATVNTQPKIHETEALLHDATGSMHADHHHRHAPPSLLERALTIGFFQRHYAAVKAVDAVLFGLSSALGFLNMLIVMAMNGRLLAGIVVGETLGVFALMQPGKGTSCH